MAVCRMRERFHHHQPVLLEEAVSAIIQSKHGIYVDCTFGRGSHSQELLNRLAPDAQVIAIDKDLEAIDYAKEKFSQESRLSVYHYSFTEMTSLLQRLHVVGKVDGILFDLGVSSPQLDDPQRGFSFSKSGPLDMRMDASQGETAQQWLAKVDELELARVLRTYGEERFARKIARAIVHERLTQPITTTKALSEIIAKAIPFRLRDKHPATRSFQAIRIAINRELEAIEIALPQALECLKIGGRLAVISFHSLEDRIVKHFFRQHEKGEALPRGLPVKSDMHYFDARLKTIGKAVKPSEEECLHNPRARSAILRIAEKRS